MTNQNNTGKKAMVPSAREALNQFKMEAANEVGVNLKQGYNGHLTSKEAGSVGGQMVKKVCPVRILAYQRSDRTAPEHMIQVQYMASVRI